MKRFSIVFLAGACLLALLAGCSKNEPEGTMTPPKGAEAAGMQTKAQPGAPAADKPASIPKVAPQ